MIDGKRRGCHRVFAGFAGTHGAYVASLLKPDGGIDQVKMAPFSPLTDFSFDFQDLLLKPVAESVPAYD